MVIGPEFKTGRYWENYHSLFLPHGLVFDCKHNQQIRGSNGKLHLDR